MIVVDKSKALPKITVRMMHRYKTLILLVFAVVLLAACKKGPRPNINLPISTAKPAKGDRAIYGLA